jgi:YbgC/YbaW family acyl-CoA thioester hydrolase
VVFEYEVLIRENHLDTYGHVNNAVYLSLFEEARWQIVTDRGYGFDRVHQTGQGPVLLELQLKFLKELKLREKIRITLEVLSYKGKVSQIKQTMIKPDGEIACEMNCAIAFFDLKQRKIIPPSDAWLQAIGLDRTNLGQ